MNPRPTSLPCRVGRIALLLLAMVLAGRVGAQVTVSNLTTSQRMDESGLVDIRFDLATDDAETTQSFVAVSVSPDGGQSWPIKSSSAFFTGDVGSNVAIGPGKHVVWDAAADRPEVLWPNCRVRVGASAGAQEITIMLPGDVPLVMVRIPAGTFVMGSPPDERSRIFNEGPQTNVTISRDFYMGKYEVTQAQWLAVMGSWPGTAPSSTSGVGPDYPAYYVSWNDAQNFVTALNAHITATGQGPATVRLPTEAEWEYACRAGTTTRFSFGDSLIGASGGDNCEDDGLRSEYMWYCGNNGASGTPAYGSKPVGGKLPNGFGLHDMHGNLWELCADWYAPSLPGGSVIDPTGPPTGSYRVGRSGSWGNDAGLCRSANRGNDYPSGRNNDCGFRVLAVQ